MTLTFTAQQYLNDKCSLGSQAVCQYLKNLTKDTAEFEQRGGGSFKQFLAFQRGTGFSTNAANCARGFASYATANGVDYKFDLADFYSVMGEKRGRNYRFPIGDITEQVKRIQSPLALAIGTLACLGLGAAEQTHVIGLDGRSLILRNNRQPIPLNDDELRLVDSLEIFKDGGPLSSLRKIVGSDDDPTLDGAEIAIAWKSGRGDVMYNIDQISLCYRVSYFLEHGLNPQSEEHIRVRQMIKRSDFQGCLANWANENYIDWETYNQILVK